MPAGTKAIKEQKFSNILIGVNNKIKIAIAGIGTVGKGLLDLCKNIRITKSNLEVSAIASRRKKFESRIFKNYNF